MGKKLTFNSMIIALILIIIAVSSVTAYLITPPKPHLEDFTQGFRGVPWGAKPQEIKGLKFRNKTEDGKTKLYTRPSDPLSFGGAQLTEIIYWFDKNTAFIPCT